MNKSIFNSSHSSVILEQAVADVIKAVAVEETAFASILNIENEIIQKAKHVSINLEEFVALNESVNGIIRNISKIQLMSQVKLQFLEELLQKIEICDETEALEE